MIVVEQIVKLSKQLFPTGRAFRLKGDGQILIRALAQSEKRAYNDALSIKDSALPDNENFTAEDATDWERRLGLVTNSSVPLADRMMAIQRKMNHPGNIPARQSATYMEGQLRAAGFDVYVFANRFDDGMGGFETETPEEFSPGYPINDIEFSDDLEFGDDVEFGGNYANQIANSIYQSVDDAFGVGGNFVNTFFIGGAVAGTYADVSQEREIEFRQLILKLKPQHSVGFLLINYI